MIASTIVLGVVSGVISSAAIFLAVKAFNSLFIPWFQSLIYRGVNISGTWHCLAFEMAQDITLELKQHAHSITGTATFVGHPPPEGTGPSEFEALRSFSITGTIQDRFVCLTLRHSDPQRLGINSYVLEAKGDGRRLEGVFSFYSVRNDLIDSCVHTLYRERALAESRRSEQERQMKLNLERRTTEKKKPARKSETTTKPDPESAGQPSGDIEMPSIPSKPAP